MSDENRESGIYESIGVIKIEKEMNISINNYDTARVTGKCIYESIGVIKK